MGDDTTSVTAALFGLAGFEILAAAEVGGELELLVQTTADLVGCPKCGAVGRAKDRRPTWVRDLPLGGRPAPPRPSSTTGTWSNGPGSPPQEPRVCQLSSMRRPRRGRPRDHRNATARQSHGEAPTDATPRPDASLKTTSVQFSCRNFAGALPVLVATWRNLSTLAVVAITLIA
jgi:hypothetical protein